MSWWEPAAIPRSAASAAAGQVETLSTPLAEQMAVFATWLTILILLLAGSLLTYGHAVGRHDLSLVVVPVAPSEHRTLDALARAAALCNDTVPHTASGALVASSGENCTLSAPPRRCRSIPVGMSDLPLPCPPIAAATSRADIPILKNILARNIM